MFSLLPRWSSGWSTAELEVFGLIPGLDEILLGFSIRNFSVTVKESGFAPDDGSKLAPYYTGTHFQKQQSKCGCTIRYTSA